MSGLVITDLKMVMEFLPTQWHARTLDGRPVYIRYKYGQLSVNIGPIGGTIDDAVAMPCWYDEQVVDDHDDIGIEDVCRLTGILIAA